MRIELAEMKRIHSRTEQIKESLNTELANMNRTLEEICANVNSSELTDSNKRLTTAITEISNKVTTNLPVIIDFLDAQIKTYEATNESTKSQIDSLISAIDNF